MVRLERPQLSYFSNKEKEKLFLKYIRPIIFIKLDSRLYYIEDVKQKVTTSFILNKFVYKKRFYAKFKILENNYDS